MVGDEANDPLAVGRGQPLTRIREPARQPVDPEPPVGVQHHLDDAWVFEEGGDRWSERGAQHARAARDRLGLEGMNRHLRPRSRADRRKRSATGMIRRGSKLGQFNKRLGVVAPWRRKTGRRQSSRCRPVRAAIGVSLCLSSRPELAAGTSRDVLGNVLKKTLPLLQSPPECLDEALVTFAALDLCRGLRVARQRRRDRQPEPDEQRQRLARDGDISLQSLDLARRAGRYAG